MIHKGPSLDTLTMQIRGPPIHLPSNYNLRKNAKKPTIFQVHSGFRTILCLARSCSNASFPSLRLWPVDAVVDPGGHVLSVFGHEGHLKANWSMFFSQLRSCAFRSRMAPGAVCAAPPSTPGARRSYEDGFLQGPDRSIAPLAAISDYDLDNLCKRFAMQHVPP